MFRRYDHLERLNHSDTEGIEIGRVFVFPKLDGTNASIWCDDKIIKCGSRNRELTLESDNHNFCSWINDDTEISQAHKHCISVNPNWILYGEWMIPHTLKTYRQDIWRKFWIFDVFDINTGKYVNYETYEPVLKSLNLDVIEPLCIINNPSQDQIQAQVETNTYLIQDGAGVGEGIVIKNYEWSNQYGRQPWAKVVKNEFKEQNRRAFGVTQKEGEFQVESAIAEEFCTPHLVGKTRAKVVADIANEHGIDLSTPNAQHTIESTYRGKIIPQLLGRVFHDLVEEECWAFIKKYKNPTIDFKKLNQHTIHFVKKYAVDLF